MKHLQIDIKKYEIKGEDILRNINFTFTEKDRVALVGGNGAGKTTLMKILYGEIKDFDGNINNIGNLKFGYLKQIYSDNEERLVQEELKNAFVEINKIKEKLEILEQNLQDENIFEEYSNLLEHFSNLGGYDVEKEIHSVANGLGIVELLDKKLVEISGGQRTKVALAKVLLEKPDILFLDEPTNFIDLSSVEWLESYLQNKWGAGYMIISHDREFLDKVCNKTYEISGNKVINFYHGNYTFYVEERKKIEKKLMENWERQEEYLGEQEKLINRFRAGSRAGWAKSREKLIDKMEKVEKPFIQSKPRFSFNYSGEFSDKIFYFKEAFIGRQEPLFYIREVGLFGKQKIGIVGENGVGKSTFLKTIIGNISLLDGTFSKAKGLKIGYYSQMHEDLDKEKTIYENFHKSGFFYDESFIAKIISSYLLKYDDVHKKVGNLSGGQQSKLAFSILGQKEIDILILDEPTNHLDYDTREALEECLNNFNGAILFISHDRYFVNKLATHIWFIENSELSVSYGTYEDFLYKKEFGIEMDMSLVDEEAELNFVLQEKLGDKEFKRLKNKFKEKRK